MARTKFIHHKGKQITLIDWSGLVDTEEALREIAEARAFVHKQPKNSVRTLTWVERIRFNQEIISAGKEMVVSNKPYVRSAAVVGISGLLKVVLQSVLQVTGREIRLFTDLEKAKDWLAEQD